MTSDNRPSVAAVVVTFNRKNLLRECLSCLLAQRDAQCDVLIIDNASTDGTEVMIATEFAIPQVRYFNTGSNLGGAGGFMCGIEAAVMLDYDYVWILDDDTMASSTALHELLQAGENLDDWGFLSSSVYWTDGSLCLANRPKKNLFSHVCEHDLTNDLIPVVMGSFVSMLIPTEVVREVGLPIGEYFIWTDDYEYSGRIAKKHPCYAVPISRVTHAMRNNTNARLSTADSDRLARFRHLYRNDTHCYRQHGVSGRAYLFCKAAYTALDVITHSPNKRIERLGILLAGFEDGKQFKPEIRFPKNVASSASQGEEAAKEAQGLDEIHAITLDILKAVVTLCEKHEIAYYLVEGSCLGAVRHNGFIPWDDDLDIAIPATRHREFEDILARELPSHYQVVRAFSEGEAELTRVIDTRVVLFGGLRDEEMRLNPWIDVFLICGLPEGKLRRELHYSRIWLRHKLFKLSRPDLILNRERSFPANIAVALARSNVGSVFLDMNTQLEKLEQRMTRYDSSTSDFVFCITWYGKKEIMPSNYYGSGIHHRFEDSVVKIPDKYDEYLRALYGNYMQYPPKSEQHGKHHVVIEKSNMIDDEC